jgi:hypothetical protein
LTRRRRFRYLLSRLDEIEEDPALAAGQAGKLSSGGPPHAGARGDVLRAGGAHRQVRGHQHPASGGIAVRRDRREVQRLHGIQLLAAELFRPPHQEQSLPLESVDDLLREAPLSVGVGRVLYIDANGIDISVAAEGHQRIAEADDFAAEGSAQHLAACPPDSLVTQIDVDSGFWLDGFMLGCSKLRCAQRLP